MASAASPTIPNGGQRTFLGHPVGLYVLFFTEMWERFSYYGMRALLILYMINYFRWTQQDASTYYKVYTSLVYVTPIIGGFLADRFLGNRWAVIIGATLMAIGHFLMAFEEFPIFMSALIFLIIGNGFFKPNMSTQVGRLYPPNDGRRDGAYTIFYMGINLGAFLSPLICGWLAENTVGGYHSGFTMAGIGMVAGLVIYLLGQPLIKELPQDGAASDSTTPSATTVPKSGALTEAEAAAQPSTLGALSHAVPMILYLLAGVTACAAPVLWQLERLVAFDAFMLAMAGLCLFLIAYICAQVQQGLRDRVLAILVLGIFVMFFWAAFEQAGNVLNIWADQQTNRYLTQEAIPPEVIPAVHEEAAAADDAKGEAAGTNRFVKLFRDMVTLKPRPAATADVGFFQGIVNWFQGNLNPMPTTWFQAINALAIFVIAPFFAWLWIALDRRGWQPSIPMKMVFGLLFMSASMAIMMEAAREEHQLTTVAVKSRGLPEGLSASPDGKLGHKTAGGAIEPFHAGRLSYDASANALHLHGVLEKNEGDRIIEATVPPAYGKSVAELQKASKEIDDKKKSVAVKLDAVPPGFDMKYAGLKKSVVEYRAADQTLIAYQPLAEKEVKGLLVAAGEPAFRDTIHELYVESTHFRVSWWWLFWSYILATLGELCLSPVGLSMVSKLAPARFATMLMGVWLLTSAFGNFAAGALGEIWGTIPPIQFFLLSTVVVGGAALVLLVLVRLVVHMMHGVK